MENIINDTILSQDVYYILLQIINSISKIDFDISDKCNIVLHYNTDVNNFNNNSNLNIVITATSNSIAQYIKDTITNTLYSAYTTYTINYYISKRKLYNNNLYDSGLYDYELIDKFNNTYNNTYIIYKQLIELHILHYNINGDVNIIDI